MTSEQQNIETVQGLLTGMDSGDVDRVLFELDENARWIGHDGEICGKTEIATMLRELRSRGSAHLANAQLHADGDQVFAEFTRQGTTDSERELVVFELTFGKVREIREYTAA